MLFERIQTRTQVEALRTVQEGPTLDYKKTVKPSELWELAKDIAAFANHLGGVILIGVGETADNKADPVGLPAALIAEIEKAYDNAQKDWCRPSPIVTFEHIPWDSGRVILGVHVEPHTLLVGAQFYALNRGGNAERANAWQFPLRVGRHNQPLTPDQLAMFMTPAIRRAVVQLESIPADKRTIQVMYRTRDSADYMHPRPVTLAEVDPLRNVLHLTIPTNPGETGAGGQRPQDNHWHYYVPLEDAEAVWQSAPEKWCVLLTGYIDGDKYFSRPRFGR